MILNSYENDTGGKDEFNRDIAYCIFCKADTPHKEGECLVCKVNEDKRVKYTQIWSCTKCKETGAVEYYEDEGIERVMNKIIEDHSRRTVLCPGGTHSLIVHSPIDGVN